jgi:hypothetical protein
MLVVRRSRFVEVMVRWRTKKQLHAVVGALLAGSLALSACTSGSAAVVTVTSNVTDSATSGSGATAGSTSGSTSGAPGSSQASGSPASTADSSATTTASSAGTTAGATTVPAGVNGGVPAGGTEPDGFQITKLKPGEKAPQFVVFSFDGTGWDEKWQYWFGIMQKVPLHFTGFLSGTYMLSDQTKDKYTGPGHKPGKSSIPWDAPSDIPVEIGNLNKSLSLGNEVGSHFNGHFCDDNTPGGNEWDVGNWNDELDQFFGLVKNVDANNGITTKLNLTGAEIRGERTPCLTGHKDDLYPALEAHGMTYDSSFTRTGLSWPVKSTDGKIWEMGMSQFPMHGTGHTQITMDYNFYAQQEPDTVLGGDAPSAAQSKIDSAQVLATYQDMLGAAMKDGVHEPIIIGNHFNDWNNNAYSDAVGNFALSACANPAVHCVPFRDLVDWMNAQDPAVLAALQNHKSNLGGCPYDKWPKCDGLIQY